MNNNEQFNGNRTHQRRNNRHGHYRKRPVKTTQVATVNPDNKASESMKQLIEILANEYLNLIRKARDCASIVPEEILDEVPEFSMVVGAGGALCFVLEEIDKKFPLSEYLPEKKANVIKKIISATNKGTDSAADDPDEEERCYDEIR